MKRDGGRPKLRPVWNEPYLETCCRSALHRLTLVGDAGRPDRPPEGIKDAPCLARLGGMGFAERRADDRWVITAAGERRHAGEVLKRA